MPETEQPSSRLADAIRATLPDGVALWCITALGSGALLVSVTEEEDPLDFGERLAVDRQIVEAAETVGSRVFPVWVPAMGAVSAISAKTPLRGRRSMIRALRHSAALVAKAEANDQRFDFAELSALAVSAVDALTILCASKGERFDGSRPFESFSNAVAEDDRFGPANVALYFHLRGLAEAAREAHLNRKRPPARLREDRHDALDAFGAFLFNAEAAVRRNTETPKIIARRRLAKRVLATVAGALAIAAGAAIALSIRPLPGEGTTPPGEPGGIVGVYHRGESFEQRVAVREDQTIRFGTNNPVHPELPADGFSIRWRGFLNFPEGGAQYLCARADDGVKVYVGDSLVIDDWGYHGSRDACEQVRVEAGWHRLLVEYFDGGGHAALGLSRGEARHETAPIPAEDLCCRQ